MAKVLRVPRKPPAKSGQCVLGIALTPEQAIAVNKLCERDRCSRNRVGRTLIAYALPYFLEEEETE